MILIPDWLNSFLTPTMLFGAGTLIGLIILALSWAMLWICSRNVARAAWDAVSEGPLLWVTWVAGVFAVAAIGIAFLAFDTQSILRSIARWPMTGHVIASADAAPASDALAEPPAVELPMILDGDEIHDVWIRSSQPLTLATPPNERGVSRVTLNVEANETESHPNRDRIFSGMSLTHWVVRNQGNEPAKVTIEVETQPEHAEVLAVFVTALGTVVLFLVYLIPAALFKKTNAIALAACKSEMAAPLYSVLLILGIVLLVLFVVIPYFTLGEDIKVLKDSGLVLIVTFCVFHTVLASSNQISDEIEGKTALTVLSKPVSRVQFILGKFLGIAWAELVILIVLGAVFLTVVGYKVIYDSGETANQMPTWQNVYLDVTQTVPGLVLVYLETLVFTTISLAVATRLPLMPNFLICFAVYTVGHLTPQIAESGLGKNEVVDFVGKLIATVLPVVDYFNVYAGIAGGAHVPMAYLGMSAVYCALYCGIAILLALAMFDDRDLA